MLGGGFLEFYYDTRRTKEQRQGLLQHLIRRIDVGPQELTIGWLFMEGGRRRVDRSLTDPKRRKGKPLKYEPAVADDDSQLCTPGPNTRKKAPFGAQDGRVVEIGANRHSNDPSITLLFKLVLEVVVGAVGAR